MARMAFGQLICFDADTAHYRFADDSRAGWDGEVVIVTGDVDSSYVVGRSGFPFAARMVLVRAFREREEHGVWPGKVTFVS